MAVILRRMNPITKIADLYADSEDDIANLPTQDHAGSEVGKVATSSTCIVAGAVEEGALYILNSAGEWVKL